MDDQHIHLMLGEQSDPVSPRHIALAIDDAQAARDYFRARKIEIHEQTLIPGADRFVISDPDGNNIELIEWKEIYQIVPISGQEI